jgi:uncharacterized protein YjcR
MPNKSRTETDIRITVAAGLFATYTRDAKEIADKLDTTERNIHRWAERDRWKEVLQTLGYTGERSFRIQTSRNSQNNPDFEKAKIAYQQALADGIPKHKIASSVSKQTNVIPETIRKWAKKYHWRDEI